MNLNKYAEDLVSRINPELEQKILKEWQTFGAEHLTERIRTEEPRPAGPFRPTKRPPNPGRIEWPQVDLNDTLEDIELMVYSQLRFLHSILEQGGGRYLSIRPNYGVGILPTMLGAEAYIMPRQMQCLPNVRSMGEDGVRRLLGTISKQEPGLWEKGYGPRILRTGEMFLQILERYPILKEFVQMENPDLQGPMDIAELLWGSDIFYAFYDDPDVVHELLNQITVLIGAVLERWRQLFPGRYTTYIGCMMVPGNIVIRDDSAMNLSPEFVEEFIIPYDSELLSKYGGGIHFCGRGDHFIAAMSKMKGLYGVNMSQPHLNDMDVILKNTIDKGIVLTVDPSCPIMSEGHREEYLYING